MPLEGGEEEAGEGKPEQALSRGAGQFGRWCGRVRKR